jgi:hypothetical protein
VLALVAHAQLVLSHIYNIRWMIQLCITSPLVSLPAQRLCRRWHWLHGMLLILQHSKEGMFLLSAVVQALGWKPSSVQVTHPGSVTANGQLRSSRRPLLWRIMSESPALAAAIL